MFTSFHEGSRFSVYICQKVMLCTLNICNFHLLRSVKKKNNGKEMPDENNIFFFENIRISE